MLTERELPADACSFTARLSEDKLACVFVARTGDREVALEFPREELQRLLLVLHHVYAEMRGDGS